MPDIVVYGTGGFGREVMFLIEDINKVENTWNVLGFLDDNAEIHRKIINGYPVLGGFDWIISHSKSRQIHVALGIGNPKTKEMLAKKLENLSSNIFFPSLIHPSVIISEHVELGKGNIICAGNILTCNIKLKDFVTINLSCTIGHDVVIEDFVTILPGCNISGNVHIKKRVEIGTNTAIIQGIEIGENTIIGAGATVVKSLPSNCTAVGTPAKPIKFHS